MVIIWIYVCETRNFDTFEFIMRITYNQIVVYSDFLVKYVEGYKLTKISQSVVM